MQTDLHVCFAQPEEVPQQTRHSMYFQPCARKIVVKLFPEEPLNKSYLSVQKEEVGRKHLVILNNLKVGGVLSCFTCWHIHIFCDLH